MVERRGHIQFWVGDDWKHRADICRAYKRKSWQEIYVELTHMWVENVEEEMRQRAKEMPRQTKKR